MTLEEKVAQMITVWEHKDRIQTPTAISPPSARRRPSERPGPGRAPVRPPRRRGPGRDRRRRRHRPAARPRRRARPRLYQRRAALGDGADPARHPDPVPRGSRCTAMSRRDATSFPQAIALASTWDPALSERIFTVAAREMRARGAITGARAGGRRRPRSALGPDRGDLWRGSVSGQRDGRSPRSAASRARPCRSARTRCSPR